MGKRLDVFLEVFGKDSASGVLAKIGQNSEKLSGTIGGVSRAVAEGIIGAELIQKTAGAAFSALNTGLDFTIGQLSSATTAQESLLATVSAFSAVGEVSFDVARGSIGRVNAELSKTAAALPGVTAAYADLAAGISDNVLIAFKNFDGTLDLPGYEEEVISLSESFGALGATSGVATADVAKGLSRAISGGSLAELGDLSLFEENAGILPQIEKALAERNVKTLEDLDVSARVGLIREVGEGFLTDEYREAAANSVGGLLESFRSALLDPTTGAFSLARDVDLTTDGTQSIFTQYNRALDKIIGDGGILSAGGPLAGVLDALGIDLPDPMLFIYRKTEQALEGIDRIAEGLSGFEDRIRSVGDIDLNSIFAGIDGGVLSEQVTMLSSAVMEKAFDIGIAALKAADLNNLSTEIGEFIGSAASDLVENFPWGKLGEFLARGAVEISEIILSAMYGIIEGLAAATANTISRNLKFLGADIGEGGRDAIASAVSFSPGRAIIGAVQNQRETGGRPSAKQSRPTTDLQRANARSMGFSPPSRRARGQFPFGLGQEESMGILQAAAMEKEAVPNANIVIANSTERITPRGVAENKSGQSGSGRSGGGSTVNVTNIFNLNMPDKSTREQAKELLAMMSSAMQDELEATLV